MTVETSDILDELKLSTPDIGARRTHLIFEAAHAEQLDPVHRAHILAQYADPDVPGTSGLFTDLTTAIRHWVEAKNMGEDDLDDDGYNKTELVDRYADQVENLAADLVPSPAVHTGPGTSVFDEPLPAGGAA